MRKYKYKYDIHSNSPSEGKGKTLSRKSGGEGRVVFERRILSNNNDARQEMLAEIGVNSSTLFTLLSFDFSAKKGRGITLLI